MIEVIGYLGTPSCVVKQRVTSADLVVGGRRHLDAFEVPEEKRIVLGKLAPAIEALTEADDVADCVVLASGDPNFYGIVRRLRLAGLHPKVTPAPSAVAMAFAAVGVPRDEAITVSAHGRDICSALALVRTHPKVAVMTSRDIGIREIAAAVPDQERWFVLAERLGESDERVQVFTRTQALKLDDIAEPNVVLVLAEHPDEMASAGTSMPIAGQFTVHHNPALVPPVAALAFASLLPRLGDILWVAGAEAQAVGAVAETNQACVLDALDPAGLMGKGLTPDLLAVSEATPELLDVVAQLRLRRVAAIGEASKPLVAALPGYAWIHLEVPAGSPFLMIGEPA